MTLRLDETLSCSRRGDTWYDTMFYIVVEVVVLREQEGQGSLERPSPKRIPDPWHALSLHGQLKTLSIPNWRQSEESLSTIAMAPRHVRRRLHDKNVCQLQVLTPYLRIRPRVFLEALSIHHSL